MQEKGSSFGPGNLTCSDLHLYRKDDEFVLAGGVGLDPDEGCVVVSVPWREAGPHHTLSLKWGNFLQNQKNRYTKLNSSKHYELNAKYPDNKNN